MEKKKNSYLPFLTFIVVILLLLYAFNVFTSRYIIISLIEGDYQELVDINTENADSLIDVNYSTLISFLENDLTDKHEYSLSFTCIDFSLVLLHNASLHNIASGLTIFDFHNVVGHAVICFNTTDMGIIFIEPQSDTDITSQTKILNNYLSGKIYGILTFWN